jgi:hypothetical protein
MGGCNITDLLPAYCFIETAETRMLAKRAFSQPLRSNNLEEHAVVFLADLGEEIHCRTGRIGNESETVARTGERRNLDLNRRGILDVISSKPLHRTLVRHSSKDSRPLDID